MRRGRRLGDGVERGRQILARRNSRSGIWIALFLAITGSVVGSLTVQSAVRRVPLEECAREADTVFVGRVVSVTTRWGDSGKMIWTDYLFQVEEAWKGQPVSYRTVSVAGGTVDGQSILVSHVPAFERHATYVVFAYDNARLVAEAVVGVEQGLFREVTDASTGQKVLLDAFGYLMERNQEGRIVRGRLTTPLDGGERAQVLTDQELKVQQKVFEAQYSHPPMPQPVYRDAGGNPLPAPEASVSRSLPKSVPVPGVPLTREDLKAFTFAVLAAAPPAAACAATGEVTP
jgi:hypothetical protein